MMSQPIRLKSFFRLLALPPLLLLLTAGSCYQQPVVKVRSYQDQPLILSAQDSSWLVINYWASWCEPCLKEIPELNRLAQSADDVQVWGIDFDNPTSADALGRKIHTLGIEFPVVLPEDVPLLELDQPQVLPATYLIAPDGSVQKLLHGPQTMATLQAEIKRLKAL